MLGSLTFHTLVYFGCYSWISHSVIFMLSLEIFALLLQVLLSEIENSFWFRFAKRKLDDYPFLGHLLQVTYAPNFEDVQDTISKLEERRRTVVNRLKSNDCFLLPAWPLNKVHQKVLHSSNINVTLDFIFFQYSCHWSNLCLVLVYINVISTLHVLRHSVTIIRCCLYDVVSHASCRLELD